MVSPVEVIYYTAPNIGFIAAFVSINNSGLTTNLRFTATTDKNETQVRCVDASVINKRFDDLYYYDIRYVTNSIIYN